VDHDSEEGLAPHLRKSWGKMPIEETEEN
jgi:hypothetical protein